MVPGCLYSGINAFMQFDLSTSEMVNAVLDSLTPLEQDVVDYTFFSNPTYRVRQRDLMQKHGINRVQFRALQHKLTATLREKLAHIQF